LKGLAHEDVLVIVAGVKSSDSLGISPLPPNARVEAFLPFKQVLPHVDVYVTNGGFGGVHYALANGVPIIVGGTTEDKPEIANRVAYSGVGINLKTNSPTPEQVQEAVKQVLNVPSYRQQAQRLQAELAAHDAPTEAALLLEQLAATRQPVVEPLRAKPGRSVVAA
jgi:UDP:flavonoid glycosyltransferase YjiC (YdhE family)